MASARRTRNLASLLSLGLAGAAVAQADAPLQGPKVGDRDVPGVRSQYVPGDVAGLGMMERPVPLRVYFDAIRALAPADVPEELRLSDAQAAALRAEVHGFAADVRAYIEIVRPEVDELLAQLPRAERRRIEREIGAIERLARGAEGALEAPDRRDESPSDHGAGTQRTPRETAEAFRLRLRDHQPPTPPGDDMPAMTMDGDAGSSEGAVLNRLREIREAAPSQGELQTRAWGLLTEAQRARVGRDLAAYQEEMQSQIQEQRLERQLAQRRQDAPLTPADATRPTDLSDAAIERLVSAVRAGERPEPLWSRLPERARARLDSLTPEERALALERFLRARREGGAAPERPG